MVSSIRTCSSQRLTEQCSSQLHPGAQLYGQNKRVLLVLAGYLSTNSRFARVWASVRFPDVMCRIWRAIGAVLAATACTHYAGCSLGGDYPRRGFNHRIEESSACSHRSWGCKVCCLTRESRSPFFNMRESEESRHRDRKRYVRCWNFA